MYCVKCGKRADEDAKFCFNCGQKLCSGGKVVFENMYTSKRAYMSVFCYIDKEFVNELFTCGRDNRLKNARFIHDITYGKHTIDLWIHNNLVEKEVELTSENPVAYVYMKRKGGTNLKDVTIEYCKEIKPYANNVSVDSINISSLKPSLKSSNPYLLLFSSTILSIIFIFLIFFIGENLKGGIKTCVFEVISMFWIVYIWVIYCQIRLIKVVEKLEMENFKQYIKAVKITNVLYVVFMIIQLCILIYFIL